MNAFWRISFFLVFTAIFPILVFSDDIPTNDFFVWGQYHYADRTPVQLEKIFDTESFSVYTFFNNANWYDNNLSDTWGQASTPIIHIPVFSSKSGIPWEYSINFYNRSHSITEYTFLYPGTVSFPFVPFPRLRVERATPKLGSPMGGNTFLEFAPLTAEFVGISTPPSDINERYTYIFDLITQHIGGDDRDVQPGVTPYRYYPLAEFYGKYIVADTYNTGISGGMIVEEHLYDFKTIPETDYQHTGKAVVTLRKGSVEKTYEYYRFTKKNIEKELYPDPGNHYYIYKVSDNQGNVWQVDHELKLSDAYSDGTKRYEFFYTSMTYPDDSEVEIQYKTDSHTFESLPGTLPSGTHTCYLYTVEKLLHKDSNDIKIEECSISMKGDMIVNDGWANRIYYEGLDKITLPNTREIDLGGNFETFRFDDSLWWKAMEEVGDYSLTEGASGNTYTITLGDYLKITEIEDCKIADENTEEKYKWLFGQEEITYRNGLILKYEPLDYSVFFDYDVDGDGEDDEIRKSAGFFSSIMAGEGAFANDDFHSLGTVQPSSFSHYVPDYHYKDQDDIEFREITPEWKYPDPGTSIKLLCYPQSIYRYNLAEITSSVENINYGNFVEVEKLLPEAIYPLYPMSQRDQPDHISIPTAGNFQMGEGEEEKIRYLDEENEETPISTRIYYSHSYDDETEEATPEDELFGLLKETVDTLGNTVRYEYYTKLEDGTVDPDGQPRKLKNIKKITIGTADNEVETLLSHYKYNEKGFLSEKYDYSSEGSYLTRYYYYGITDNSILSTYNLTYSDADGASTDGNYAQLAVITSPNPDTTGERVYRFKYNARGLKIWEKDPEGLVQEWEYFATGIWQDYLYKYTKPYIDVPSPDKKVVEYSYAYANGRMEKTEKQTLGTDQIITTSTFDQDGNLLEVEYPGAKGLTTNDKEKYNRDGEGNLLQYIDKDGNSTLYTINEAGWVLTRAVYKKGDVDTNGNPSGDPLNSVSYTYDTKGNIVSKTATGYPTVYYKYDAFGRKIKEGYDPYLGEMGDADDESEKPYAWFYNTEGWVTKETDRKGNTVFHKVEFDEYGNVASYEKPFTNKDGDEDQIKKSFTYDKYGDSEEGTLKMDETGVADRIHSSEKNAAGETVIVKDNEYATKYIKDIKGRTVAVIRGKMSGDTFDAGRKAVCTIFNEQGNVIYTYSCPSSIINNASDVISKINDSQSLMISETEFDDLGRVIFTTDSSGAKTTYRYDLKGRVTGIQDGNDEFKDFDPFTEIIYSTDADGNQITTTKSPERVADSLKGIEVITKTDASGRTLEETVNGQTTKYVYVNDKLKWVVAPTIDIVRDLEAGGTEPSIPLTRYAYDDRGRIAGIYRGYAASGVVITASTLDTFAPELIGGYTYDHNSNVETVSDTGGIVATNTYNQLNQQTSTTDQMGVSEASDRNKAGELKTQTDELENTTEYNRTDSGLPEETVLPDGTVFSTVYTPNEGWLYRNTDGNGSRMTYAWTDLGQFAGLSVTNTPDTFYGTISRVIRPQDRDNLGRVIMVKEDNGDGSDVFTSYEYKPNSSLIQKETTTIDTFSADVEYVYDNDNRVSKIIYPSARELEYVYNSAGYLETIKFDGDVICTYEYDNAGNVIKKYLGGDSASFVLRENYDIDYRGYLYEKITTVSPSWILNDEVYHRYADGRIKAVENVLQTDESKQYEYDSGERLIAATVGTLDTNNNIPSGSENPAYDLETFEYDALGNIIETAPVGTDFSRYDGFDAAQLNAAYNIVSGQWWQAASLLNTADRELARIELIQDQKDVRTFSTTVQLPTGELYAAPVIARMYFSAVSDNNYRYAGLRTTLVAVPGAASTDPPQIKRLLIVEVGKVAGGSEIVLTEDRAVIDADISSFRLDFELQDDAGKTGELTCTYASGSSFVSAPFNFSKIGKAGFYLNRRGKGFHAKFTEVNITGKDFTANDFSVNELNQYSIFNDVSCLWDGNGNLKSWGQIYKYDAFNRLTKAPNVEYLYDAKNRRVAKIVGGDIYTYIYHGWSVIAEYKNGTLLREFIDGLSIDEHLCMQNASGQKYYYALDTRNGVDKIVSESGQLVESYQYKVYGETTIFNNITSEEITVSSIGNPYGFQGRRIDHETGFMHFRNRQYSPVMKRFISMDPLRYVDSMNLYETLGGDPVNYFDPLGLIKLEPNEKVAEDRIAITDILLKNVINQQMGFLCTEAGNKAADTRKGTLLDVSFHVTKVDHKNDKNNSSDNNELKTLFTSLYVYKRNKKTNEETMLYNESNKYAGEKGGNDIYFGHINYEGVYVFLIRQPKGKTAVSGKKEVFEKVAYVSENISSNSNGHVPLLKSQYDTAKSSLIYDIRTKKAGLQAKHGDDFEIKIFTNVYTREQDASTNPSGYLKWYDSRSFGKPHNPGLVFQISKIKPDRINRRNISLLKLGFDANFNADPINLGIKESQAEAWREYKKRQKGRLPVE